MECIIIVSIDSSVCLVMIFFHSLPLLNIRWLIRLLLLVYQLYKTNELNIINKDQTVVYSNIAKKKYLSTSLLLLLYLTNDYQSDPYDQVKKGILKHDGIYRGLTYGHYLSEWLKMIHSDSPFYRGYPREICYLSGNYSFVYDKDTGKRKQSEEFQNKARNRDGTYRGLIVYQDTAIFVPVHCSFYSVGESHYYNGGVLQSIAD